MHCVGVPLELAFSEMKIIVPFKGSTNSLVSSTSTVKVAEELSGGVPL